MTWINKNIGGGEYVDYALTPHAIAFYMDETAPNRMPETDQEIRGAGGARNAFTRDVVMAVGKLYAQGKLKQIKAAGGKYGVEGWNKTRGKNGRSIFKGGKNPDILFYAA